jgi:hypothetical protein
MIDDCETEWREEADRLRLLPTEAQRQVIDLHRSTAADPNATRADCHVAWERAEFLSRLLGLSYAGREVRFPRRCRIPPRIA